jgi:Cu/Ag efflux pump CusA
MADNHPHADITNQTLNFGLSAPIDVQVRGKDAASTAQIAETLQEQIKNIPGGCVCPDT